jgi:hypothetical protein
MKCSSFLFDAMFVTVVLRTTTMKCRENGKCPQPRMS